jgi:hypothetical protein
LPDQPAQIDAVAKIRGWFRPQDDSCFYPIIQKYRDEQLDKDEASSQLYGPIDEKINARKLDDVNFMDLWFSLLHSARRVSFREAPEQNTIVDLINAFKEHSIPDNEQYNYIYSSLTDFDMACREAYNDAPVAHNGFIDVEVDAWANMNFFFALATSQGLHDLSLYCIYAMRTALETPYEDDETSTAIQKFEAHLPAAAAWIAGYGNELYRTEKDLTPADRKHGNPARGGPLWKGKSEFSKERWAFWKDRFGEIGRMEGTSESTKVLARDTVEAMERSETYEHMR